TAALTLVIAWRCGSWRSRWMGWSAICAVRAIRKNSVPCARNSSRHAANSTPCARNPAADAHPDAGAPEPALLREGVQVEGDAAARLGIGPLEDASTGGGLRDACCHRRRLAQCLQGNAGIQPALLEQVHQILGGDIAGRARRKRATA